MEEANRGHSGIKSNRIASGSVYFLGAMDLAETGSPLDLQPSFSQFFLVGKRIIVQYKCEILRFRSFFSDHYSPIFSLSFLHSNQYRATRLSPHVGNSPAFATRPQIRLSSPFSPLRQAKANLSRDGT
jgi:hypothetical protein